MKSYRRNPKKSHPWRKACYLKPRPVPSYAVQVPHGHQTNPLAKFLTVGNSTVKTILSITKGR